MLGRRTYKKKYGAKRFVKRSNKKSQMFKRIPLDGVSVKCELDTNIYVAFGSTAYNFDIAQPYYNLNNIIQNSFTWNQTAPSYGRFRINGIHLRATRIFTEKTVDTNLAGDVNPVYIAFYPQFVSSNIGTAVAYNDNHLRIEPFNSLGTTKYWKFPSNFFESNGLGLGIWCNPANISNLPGELAAFCPDPTSVAVADTYLYNLKITVYIDFSSKNQ